MPKTLAQKTLVDKLVPVLLVGSLVLAFAVGILWERVNNLEKGKTSGSTAGTGGTQPSAQVNPQVPTQGKLSADQVKKIPEVNNDDHIQGDKNAQITLIEYSDFQCPFCSRFHPTTKQILDEYKGKVRLVYRHFPLDQLHPQARPAALASECIADIGGESAFWKFADNVFADQTKLSDIPALAVSAGVNKAAFQSCFDANKFKDRVESDYQGGISAGVTGTPGTFIINSKGEAWLIPGALPFEQIKTTIEEALKS